ncbi:hypothetical protein BDB00DRAFT_827718 [Zychaea mexicana]|uniref:uncharacterized protein n=1 Tax=Zychaea mexicana TaxID=64656 RepID=UPI0022FF43EB|nr:uncharacterized protein BDB00DRAFT_827718 [Zychaea mexicana]KAI9492512.1 hypothetical protein BDB00DRAFT_827718 [Zychaea mexicana]
MYVNGWRSRTNFRILRSSLQVRQSRRCSTWATSEHAIWKDFGGLDQEKAVAMYHSLSDESKTHRGRLQSAHAAAYREVPDHVKRTEWKKFEENVKYMYKLPLDKCEQHWCNLIIFAIKIVRNHTNVSELVHRLVLSLQCKQMNGQQSLMDYTNL